MTHHVTVFETTATGATGDPLGYAVPVAPRVVLGAPEFADHLGTRRDVTLRVATAIGIGVDVVDVVAVHRLSPDVVALELARPFAMGTNRLTPVAAPPANAERAQAREHVVAAAADVAAGLGDLSIADEFGNGVEPWGDDEPQGGLWCGLFGIGCHHVVLE